MFKYVTSTLLLALLAIGCAPTKGPSGVTPVPTPTATPQGPASPVGPAPQGGSDTGGANGLEVEAKGASESGPKYRTLESFCKDGLGARSEYNDYVLPIITKIAQIHPRFASDMLHIVDERHWCFAPVELNQIPSARLGVEFNTVQIVRHGKKEIWLDTRKLDRNSASDNGLILFHEIIMGVAFMKFQDELDNCKSEVAILKLHEESKDQYRVAREGCYKKHRSLLRSNGNLLPQRPISLNMESNLNIRELVIKLWRTQGDISPVELSTWLEMKDFRKY